MCRFSILFFPKLAELLHKKLDLRNWIGFWIRPKSHRAAQKIGLENWNGFWIDFWIVFLTFGFVFRKNGLVFAAVFGLVWMFFVGGIRGIQNIIATVSSISILWHAWFQQQSRCIIFVILWFLGPPAYFLALGGWVMWRMDGQMDGWMDEWMSGWTDGRMDGWMDDGTNSRVNVGTKD